jgi:SAM-dependent methyltransferase
VEGWVERKETRSRFRPWRFRPREPATFTLRYRSQSRRPFVRWVKREDVAAALGAPEAADWGFELQAMFPDAEAEALYKDLELVIQSGDEDIVIDRAAEHSSLNRATEIWNRFLECPRESMVEIGARARSGITRREMFGACDYIGFDVVPGENVDVVGDAHFLSQYFDHQVDAVVSLSTFEHLIMPWRVVEEINRVLKPGGLVITQTHQTWPVHDQPWDFLRFSKDAWRGLFNEATGFRILDAAECGPCVLTPVLQQRSNWTTRLENQRGYMVSICLAQKTGEPQVGWTIDRPLYERIVGSAGYPG